MQERVVRVDLTWFVNRRYRAEGVLDSLAAYAHLVRVPIKLCLYGLKDGFVLPA
jgi:hypothetical protein